MTDTSFYGALPHPAGHEWMQNLDVWHNSSDWRQQWAALKKLVHLDRECFPGQFLPIACQILSDDLPHNICWLKTLSQYAATGVQSLDQANTLWDALEHSRQRVLNQKRPDDNQLAWHLRPMSELDRNWFPGRLRPILFQILNQSLLPSSSEVYGWRVFNVIYDYLRHDTDKPEIWHQWSKQLQQLFHQAPLDSRHISFALAGLLYLDEFHIPGIAHQPICQWLHQFPHSTNEPWQLLRAIRRYTLKVARNGHDDLAYAWKAWYDHSPCHSPIAFQTLNRLRSRLEPQTWETVRPVPTSSGTSSPTDPMPSENVLHSFLPKHRFLSSP